MSRPKGRPASDASIIDARSQMVVKANELIQKSRFNLTLQEQKIVLYLISKISPYDEDFKVYEFSIPEFCKVCGINCESGENYKDLKEAIKGIADKSVWAPIPGTRQATLWRWIEKPTVDLDGGVVTIRFDNDMRPFLLQLRENFTKYELIWTLRFRSKYSVRLYELVTSLQFNEMLDYTRTFEVEDIKYRLGAERYKTFQHFRDRALDPAVKEVNAYSDKNVWYTTVKNGRSIVQVILNISSKDSITSVKLRNDIEKDFSLDQMTLWDRLLEKGHMRSYHNG